MNRFSIYQIPVAERAAYLAEQKARGAAEKARKLALAKTCQCCFRQIFAETGTIAHHGYERPGHGWQTASCVGAKMRSTTMLSQDINRVITIDQLKQLTALQAEDDALWAPGRTIDHAYVQQALRFLTKAIEGEWTFNEAEAAIKDMMP